MSADNLQQVLESAVGFAINYSLEREARDDHLSDDQRAKVVALYRAVYPTCELPENIDDAYVAILFDGGAA